MIVAFDKRIAALPATLVANTVYFVRAGAGFDLYLSDATGAFAHKVNGSGGITEAQSRARAFMRC